MRQVFCWTGGDSFSVFAAIEAIDGRFSEIFRDLLVVAEVGPENLANCRALRNGIWELRHPLEPGATAIVLFCLPERQDIIVALHGFKARSGVSRHDLKVALQRKRSIEKNVEDE